MLVKFMSVVLSRERRVFTLSCGNMRDSVTEPTISVCCLILCWGPWRTYWSCKYLQSQPTGMSMYSVGCGFGGKLRHCSETSENQPRLIEQFSLLNMEPVMVSAGAWHAAVVGSFERVCTWGWGRFDCLGHGTVEPELDPRVVEGLKDVRAVHAATGDYTTFVVSEDGQEGDVEENTLTPKLVLSLKEVKERVVHVSLTNSVSCAGHTFAMTESGKVYAFGTGDRGKLGVELSDNVTERANRLKLSVLIFLRDLEKSSS